MMQCRSNVTVAPMVKVPSLAIARLSGKLAELNDAMTFTCSTSHAALQLQSLGERTDVYNESAC